jgi:hypothetical protein
MATMKFNKRGMINIKMPAISDTIGTKLKVMFMNDIPMS